LHENYFNRDGSELLPFVPARRDRVLEINCGEGLLSGYLSGTQEVWGTEPSLAVGMARKRLTHVFQGTFDQTKASLPLAHFDLIICNDGLSRMPDHAGFLRDIRNFLLPGGMLIGSVANVRHYQTMFEYVLERDWCYRGSGTLNRAYFSFFTERSLRRAFKLAGFTVIQLKGVKTGTLGGNLRQQVYYGLACLLSALTFGYFSDILPLQFAFQAVPAAPAPAVDTGLQDQTFAGSSR